MAVNLPKKSRDYIRFRADQIRSNPDITSFHYPSKLYELNGNYYHSKDLITDRKNSIMPGFDSHYVNCFSDAVEKFFIAKELGLEPRFFMVYNVRDKKEKNNGCSSGAKGLEQKLSELVGDDSPDGADHSFIDVKIRQRKTRVIVDPLMGNFGFIKYDDDARQFRVSPYDPEKKEVKEYDYMIELDEKELLKKISFYETPTGFARMLEPGQKIAEDTAGKNQAAASYVRYHPDENELEVQVHLSNQIYLNHCIKNRIRLDPKASRSEEIIDLSCYSNCEWMSLNNEIKFGSFLLKDVKAYWKALESSFSKRYKSPSSHISSQNYKRVSYEKKDSGFPGLYELARGEKGIDELIDFGMSSKDAKDMIRLSENAKESFNQIIDNKDFTTFCIVKSYIEDSVYEARLDELKKQGKDNEGYIFTEKERYGLFRETQRQGYKYALKQVFCDDILGEIKLKARAGRMNFSKKKVRQKKAQYSARANEAYKKNSDYYSLLAVSKRQFNNIRDNELSIAHFSEEINELEQKAVDDFDSFKDEHYNGMLKMYLNVVEEMMIRSYHCRSRLQLRGLFKHMQPKIKTYLDEKRS